MNYRVVIAHADGRREAMPGRFGDLSDTCTRALQLGIEFSATLELEDGRRRTCIEILNIEGLLEIAIMLPIEDLRADRR